LEDIREKGSRPASWAKAYILQSIQ
jgi:hypothetical protein